MQFPLWATPVRQAYLVALLESSGGLCVYGHPECVEYEHFYFALEDRLVNGWKEDDRDERAYLWKLEWLRLHSQRRIRTRGAFDTLRREEYLANRPVFRIVSIGVNAFTQRRVAQVELPDLEKKLWIDIGDVELSRNKLRKVSRYPRRGEVPDAINQYIAREMRRYL